MFINVLNWFISIVCGLGFTAYRLFNCESLTASSILVSLALGLLVFVISFIAAFLLIWIFFIIIALTINPKKEYKTPSAFYNFIFQNWFRYVCAFFRVKIKIAGTENLPKDKKYLAVCNHRSGFDAFIVGIAMHPEQVSFITKPENMAIPLAHNYMIRGLYLSIDRENTRNALKTIIKAIEYISNNIISVCVFPEGTRSKDGKLGEFKPGCLKVAEKAECPIAVFTLQGTEKIMKNFPWRRTNVTINMLRVIQPEEFAEKTTVDISDEIRSEMLKKLGE